MMKNSVTSHKLVICICTYQRELLLFECLSSLSRMDFPELTKVSILVADNDKVGSAEKIVSKVSGSLQFPIDYIIEARRGIPCVRNAAINFSLKGNVDYLIFIDDDETVTKNWLVELYNYSQVKGGDVVISGVVKSVIPENINPSISYFFTRDKNRVTGDKLSSCATNNVLIPLSKIKEYGLCFDESSPLAGGTDTKFFVEATGKGIQIYRCADAIVNETVPSSRCSIKWLAKRKYRAGITDAWRKKISGKSVWIIVLSSICKMILQLFLIICSLITFQSLLKNKATLRLCKDAGILMGVLGRKVDSYQVIDK